MNRFEEFKDTLRNDLSVLKQNAANLILNKKASTREALKIISVEIAILEMILARAEKMS